MSYLLRPGHLPGGTGTCSSEGARRDGWRRNLLSDGIFGPGQPLEGYVVIDTGHALIVARRRLVRGHRDDARATTSRRATPTSSPPLRTARPRERNDDTRAERTRRLADRRAAPRPRSAASGRRGREPPPRRPSRRRRRRRSLSRIDRVGRVPRPESGGAPTHRLRGCSATPCARPSTPWRCARSRRRSGRPNRRPLRGADRRRRRADDWDRPTAGWRSSGLRLHYLDWGGAGRPPVLFLHGGSARTPIGGISRSRCSPNAFAASRSDLRGHGESSRPANADYGLPRTRPTSARSSARSDSAAAASSVTRSAAGWRWSTPAAPAGPSARSRSSTAGRTSACAAPACSRRCASCRTPGYASHDDAITRFRLLPAATRADAAVVAHVAAHGVIREADGTYLPRFDRRALRRRRRAGSDATSARGALPDPRRARRAQRDRRRRRLPDLSRRGTRRRARGDRRRASPRSCSTSRLRSPTCSATSSDDTSTARA